MNTIHSVVLCSPCWTDAFSQVSVLGTHIAPIEMLEEHWSKSKGRKIWKPVSITDYWTTVGVVWEIRKRGEGDSLCCWWRRVPRHNRSSMRRPGHRTGSPAKQIRQSSQRRQNHPIKTMTSQSMRNRSIDQQDEERRGWHQVRTRAEAPLARVW
jgi:hypothetical protein